MEKNFPVKKVWENVIRLRLFGFEVRKVLLIICNEMGMRSHSIHNIVVKFLIRTNLQLSTDIYTHHKIDDDPNHDAKIQDLLIVPYLR